MGLPGEGKRVRVVRAPEREPVEPVTIPEPVKDPVPDREPVKV